MSAYLIARYHGRFLARGGQTITLEGPHESRRMLIIEFPLLQNAQNFYQCPEYAQARKLRECIAQVEFVAVEGVG